MLWIGVRMLRFTPSAGQVHGGSFYNDSLWRCSLTASVLDTALFCIAVAGARAERSAVSGRDPQDPGT